MCTVVPPSFAMDTCKPLLVLAALLGILTAVPVPDGGHHHKKYVIHVPFKIHTIHHHHVRKIPIYHHYEHFDHHHHHHHHHEEQHHDFHDDYHDEHY